MMQQYIARYLSTLQELGTVICPDPLSNLLQMPRTQNTLFKTGNSSFCDASVTGYYLQKHVSASDEHKAKARSHMYSYLLIALKPSIPITSYHVKMLKDQRNYPRKMIFPSHSNSPIVKRNNVLESIASPLYSSSAIQQTLSSFWWREWFSASCLKNASAFFGCPALLLHTLPNSMLLLPIVLKAVVMIPEVMTFYRIWKLFKDRLINKIAWQVNSL